MSKETKNTYDIPAETPLDVPKTVEAKIQRLSDVLVTKKSYKDLTPVDEILNLEVILYKVESEEQGDWPCQYITVTHSTGGKEMCIKVWGKALMDTLKKAKDENLLPCYIKITKNGKSLNLS